MTRSSIYNPPASEIVCFADEKDGKDDSRGATGATPRLVMGFTETTEQLLDFQAALEVAAAGVHVRLSGGQEGGSPLPPLPLLDPAPPKAAPQGNKQPELGGAGTPATVLLQPVLQGITQLVKLMKR